jgi:NAD(P)-dependent dehydrogenase (short-subunit alcohol dehydrogenase family)
MIQPITSLKDAFSIAGQTAIITGGNGGIGLGIGEAMAQAGANVAVLCRNMEKAETALKQLRTYGGKHEGFFCDTASLESVRKAVAEVYASYGEVNILVNNAGVTYVSEFLDMNEDFADWHRVLNTDLNGVAYMTYEVGKRMRAAKKGGAIINITSMSGVVVHKAGPRSSYNAAKAGANHFTRAMAVELGKYNIRVNAIAPGYIRAGFTANLPPELEGPIKEKQPLDRFGEGIEVGALAVFLASPAANHLTGTIQMIDGGAHFTL